MEMILVFEGKKNEKKNDMNNMHLHSYQDMILEIVKNGLVWTN